MEKFKPPKLPKMLNNSVMCIDASAWNQLIEYVNSQTMFINSLTEIVDKVSIDETSHGEAITKIAEMLKEHLQE